MTKGDLLLLDGALGTALAARGIVIDGPAWSARALVEAPAAVGQLHADYARAGATVHTANTFRVTREALAAWRRAGGPELDAGELLVRAVQLVRENVPRGHLVAASMAPAADCYAPAPDPPRARAHHREQVELLRLTQPDRILCETFRDGVELELAVEQAAASGIPVWAALTAGPGGTLNDASALRRAAERAVAAGAQALFLNCTAAAQSLALLPAVRGLGVPFGVYANAGAAADRLGFVSDWGEAPPDPVELAARADRYARLAEGWVAAGATIVGGCCGTFPEHIAAIARLVGERAARLVT